MTNNLTNSDAPTGYLAPDTEMSPEDRLNNVLHLLGHNESTMPVHSSNLLHSIEMFSASSGDTALENAVRARIDMLRKTITAT